MATFDERARDWDTEDHTARALAVAEAVRAAVPLSPTMRVLEIGAGTGLLGLALADEIGTLRLTDTSAGMLEVAAEKVRREGRANVTVARLDLTADPGPRDLGPFDLVLALLMLHHVEDTAALLRSMTALLEPGGWLALGDLDREDGTFHDADAEGIHHHGFARDALGRLAGEAGLEAIAFRTATEIERDGRRYPLFLMTARRPSDGPDQRGR